MLFCTRKCDLSQKVWFLGNWCDKISEGVIFFISQNQTFYTHLISFLDKHQTKTHQMICFVNPLLQNPVWFGFDSILGFNWQILAFLIKNFKPKRNFLKNLVLKNAIKRLGRVILGNFSYVCVIFSLEMVWFLAKGVWFSPLKWCDFWQQECVFHPKPSGHTQCCQIWGFFPNVGIFRVKWGSLFFEWGSKFKVSFWHFDKKYKFS